MFLLLGKVCQPSTISEAHLVRVELGEHVLLHAVIAVRSVTAGHARELGGDLVKRDLMALQEVRVGRKKAAVVLARHLFLRLRFLRLNEGFVENLKCPFF
jgi:hypothetical protein